MVEPQNKLSPEAFNKLVKILAIEIPKMEKRQAESKKESA